MTSSPRINPGACARSAALRYVTDWEPAERHEAVNATTHPRRAKPPNRLPPINTNLIESSGAFHKQADATRRHFLSEDQP